MIIARLRNAEPEEVFRMRWEHYGLGEQSILRLRSKTPKGRRFVPVSPRVRKALWHGLFGSEEGWVFPSKRAKCGHLTTVEQAIEKARDSAGLPKDLVLYCARHGFWNRDVSRNQNLFAVMNVMGHTTVSTTMKYEHQDIDEVAMCPFCVLVH